jgi:glycosyltransferase involved in cell wall biosynthesis
VLVTPEVGVADLVRKSGGGIVVTGEAAAVARGLNLLLADPAASYAMGAAGRAYVSARYDWSSVAASMEDLYDSLLSARG